MRKTEPSRRNYFAKGIRVAQFRIIELSGLLTSTPVLYSAASACSFLTFNLGIYPADYLLSPCTC